MTRAEVRRSSFLIPGVCALLLASGCSTSSRDSTGSGADLYRTPDLKVLDEAPPVAYTEVYVPVDAHAFHENGEKLGLSSTLVLRNPNRHSSVVVRRVDLYGQDGTRLRRVAGEPFELEPFASVEFLTAEGSRGNGLGRSAAEQAAASHYIVQWGSTGDGKAPLIESVMVNSAGTLLHVRPGQELRTIPPAAPAPRARSKPSEPSAQAIHASAGRAPASPEYELIRYDSNMGLSNTVNAGLSNTGLRPKNP